MSMNEGYTADKLIDKLKKQNFYIYGTGFVAEHFYEALNRLELSKNTVSFVTTHNQNSEYHGIPVKSIKDINDDLLICIAVHEANLKEIVEVLNERGLKNYVWIYPFIFDMWYGEPIKKGVLVPTNEILTTCKNDYRIVIRVLAIEEYYKINKIGYSIYMKAQQVHSSPDTARKRLEQFIKLIASWEDSGYSNDSKLKIDENNEIFDGVHRLALAYYHGISKVNCDIYRTLDNKPYINDEVKLTEKIIEEINYYKDERDELNQCLYKLRNDIQ
ncbi:hypothetical protein [Butyrivibrio sp. WCE2006]|uniref:hypothetical protein n=1 Tax=Butyrivibrio sp. WCE2006 TaxID=1410611 RepID=UPI0005D25F7D|nr:hypothetical protein [Butyrivibrio sp. WCE2006]